MIYVRVRAHSLAAPPVVVAVTCYVKTCIKVSHSVKEDQNRGGTAFLGPRSLYTSSRGIAALFFWVCVGADYLDRVITSGRLIRTAS